MKKNTFIISVLILTTVLLSILALSNKEKRLVRKDVPKIPEEITKETFGTFLLVGFRGTELATSSPEYRMFSEVKPGGVLLYNRDFEDPKKPRNITGRDQLKELIAQARAIAGEDLTVAADVEGGYVNRLKPEYGFLRIPSHAELGTSTPKNTKEIALQIAQELADVGIDLNLAPVVDVNVNPASPAIGALERSFSADPKIVSLHAGAFIEAHQELGIGTSLKHFPGHGSAGYDTHLGVVDVTKTYKAEELEPYKTLIEGGYADAVMTAHVINKDVSPLPATLSKEFLTDILRDELEFKGVVITDDLLMGAIMEQYGLADAAVRAFEAGSDWLIISNNIDTYDLQSIYTVRDALYDAYTSGRISEERVKQSLRRIQEFKSRY